MKEKSLVYDFDIVHVEGTRNKAADALSRHPVDEPSISSMFCNTLLYNYLRADIDDADYTISMEIENNIEAFIIPSLTSPGGDNTFQAITLARVKTESSKDESISQLIDFIINGFPMKIDELPEKLHGYWNVRHELYVLDNIVLYGYRVIITKTLRRELLEALHSAHQGTTGMKARASQCFFWPGINRDIDPQSM